MPRATVRSPIQVDGPMPVASEELGDLEHRVDHAAAAEPEELLRVGCTR